jgi:hypothetical protein
LELYINLSIPSLPLPLPLLPLPLLLLLLLLQVAWVGETADAEESGDLPPCVNPWEIDMLNYPLDLMRLNYSY